VLPRRLGVRFTLEALFLVLVALGAGFAHLRPLYILAAMALAWLLVALAELTAERIDRSPLSYLLPGPAPVEGEQPDRVFGPRPEERTVVAPPEALAAEPPATEAAPEAEQIPVAEPEPEPELEPEPEPEPEPAAAETSAGPTRRQRLRARLRRREPELESTPSAPPRHVKLLPRRSAPEPSRAAQEVAELFGSAPDQDGEPESEETSA